MAAANLNTALVALSWAQIEPEEGTLDWGLVDYLIQELRLHNLKLVFLWFGSWKNGLSSYAPYWVKKDYRRFPRIRLGNSNSIELLGPMAPTTRDADARAFRQLMRHIKDVDGRQHTVLMMQVENEAGLLRDSRDRSTPANDALYFERARGIDKLRALPQGFARARIERSVGRQRLQDHRTWEQIFGPGKPASVEMPIQTTSPPMSRKHMTPPGPQAALARRRILHGLAIRAVRQQDRRRGQIGVQHRCSSMPGCSSRTWRGREHIYVVDLRPKSMTSGGPARSPSTCSRRICICLSSTKPPSAFPAQRQSVLHPGNASQRQHRSGCLRQLRSHGVLAFRHRSAGSRPGARLPWPTGSCSVWSRSSSRAPGQAVDHCNAHESTRCSAQRRTRRAYTLALTYVAKAVCPSRRSPPPPERLPEATEAVAIFIASGPDEFYMEGGGFRIAFTANTPGPATVGLGIVREGRFVDGKWVVVRQLGGDDIGQGEILALRPNTILRFLLYRYE